MLTAKFYRWDWPSNFMKYYSLSKPSQTIPVPLNFVLCWDSVGLKQQLLGNGQVRRNLLGFTQRQKRSPVQGAVIRSVFKSTGHNLFFPERFPGQRRSKYFSWGAENGQAGSKMLWLKHFLFPFLLFAAIATPAFIRTAYKLKACTRE